MYLQRKLFLVTAVPLFIIFLLIVFLTEKMVTNSLEDDARALAQSIAETSVAEVQASISELHTALYEMASNIAILEYKHHDSINRSMMFDMFEDSLASRNIFGGSMYLVKNAIDFGGPQAEYYFYRDDSGKYNRTILSDTDKNAPWYTMAYTNKKETLTEPYVFNIKTLDYVSNPTSKDLTAPGNIFMITLAMPIILHDGSVAGVVTMDFRVSRFHDIVKEVKPYGTGYAVLTTNKGTILSSPNTENWNTNFGDMKFMKNRNPKDIIKATGEGKLVLGPWTDTRDNSVMAVVALPMSLGDYPPLSFMLMFKENDAYAAVGLPIMKVVSRGILLMIIVIIVATTIVMRRSIIRYLLQFMDAMKDLTEGDGDLTKKINIKTGDEFEMLSDYLNKFVENLRHIINDVKNSAEEVASGNNQLAATMEELSTTFSSQSEQVSSVAGNMDVINDTSKTMVESLGMNVSKMNDAKGSMHDGSTQLNVAVSNMNDIQEKNRSLSITVDHLADSSNKIGDILGVINDIADQTNLLALNAAIEAARAGDAGRGFAVVADEVRKLAERTQRSTSEISAIISTLQKETANASTEMKGATASVADGLNNILKTDEVFKAVVSVVNEIDTTTQEVNGGISDQFNMVQTINDNTQALASGIEESVHAVNEVSKTVAHLQKRAETLKNIVAKFKVD